MILDTERLAGLDWRTEPFPHAVGTGLWDLDLLRLARSEYPSPADPRWVTYPQPEEYGKRCGGPEMWTPAVVAIIEALRSEAACQALSDLTGIGPLYPDTAGGGMHMTTEGGRLEKHIDFNFHPDNPDLERRLNLLVFLEDQWQSDWGGTLLIGPRGNETAVMPMIDNTVIFATSQTSWHGHPDAIKGDHRRRSVAVYYYAPAVTAIEHAHTTVWEPET